MGTTLTNARKLAQEKSKTTDSTYLVINCAEYREEYGSDRAFFACRELAFFDAADFDNRDKVVAAYCEGKPIGTEDYR